MRLADVMTQLSRETAEGMENLHRLLDAKLADLQAQVVNGEVQRQEDSEAVARRIEGMGAELSQRLEREAEVLTQRISEHHRDAIGHIDHAVGLLDERKTDRAMMEQVFTEMASRVRGR
jgi:phage terminase small subunit